MSKHSIKVEIYGAQYTLRVDDEDTEKALEIAALVDKTMREIRDKTGYDSPANLAILAALNIAEKLYESQRKLASTTRRLLANLDEVIKE